MAITRISNAAIVKSYTPGSVALGDFQIVRLGNGNAGDVALAWEEFNGSTTTGIVNLAVLNDDGSLFHDGITVDQVQELDTNITGDPLNPTSIYVRTGGEFNVLWDIDFSSVDEPFTDRVKIGNVDSNGVLDTTLLLQNTANTPGQVSPFAVELGNGNTLFLWGDTMGATTPAGLIANPGLEVRGQIFNAAGTPVGAEGTYNNFGAGIQIPVGAISLGNGSTTIFFHSGTLNATNDFVDSGLYVRMLNTAGTPIGVETAIDGAAPAGYERGGFQFLNLATGGFVAVWGVAKEGDGSTTATNVILKARLYTAAGTPVAAATTVASVNAIGADLYDLQAVELANGGYALTWITKANTASSPISHVQMYDRFGVAIDSNGSAAGLEATYDQVFVDPTLVYDPDVDYTSVQGLTLLGDGNVMVLLENDTGTNLDLSTIIVDTGFARDLTSDRVLLDGTAAGDTLYGKKFYDDHIRGLGGNDLLYGWSGDDNIEGGDGNDTLDGGVGADSLTGGAGNDIYVVDSVSDSVVETGATPSTNGIDTIQSSITYSISALGNIENLTLTGTADNDATGNALNNILTGNSGKNTLDGDAGNDTMVGGDGNDIYVVGSALDVVTETNAVIATGGTDTVQTTLATYTLGANVENLTFTNTGNKTGTGNAGNNVITGHDGNDTLNGAAGNDTLNGGIGNDTLDGGTGNDTLVGGAGNDIYIVDSLTDVVTEAAGDAADTVQSSITYSIAGLANIENLTLTGAAVINATGNSGDNILTGNSAANTFTGGGGKDRMIGLAGNDSYVVDSIDDTVVEAANAGTDTVTSSVNFTLDTVDAVGVENLSLTGSATNATGNALANVLIGNGGDNKLDGKGGADNMSGGLGNDTYVVDNVGDVVTEALDSGVDTVESSINYTLAANLENLVLTGTANLTGTGNAFNNKLTGNDGNNTLDGGLGTDIMAGGKGDDIYIVNESGETITELDLEGVDTVRSTQSFVLGAFIENLTLLGSLAIDGTGNALDNIIIGNGAVNTLLGGDGNDRLDGGAGADFLSGGDGNDTYVIDNAGDTIEVETDGIDTIETTTSYVLANGSDIENLTLIGAALNATGNSGQNKITGNASANVLDGGGDIDEMDGLGGNDTYKVDNAGDIVSESLTGAAGGTDLVIASVDYTISDVDVENLTILGPATKATGNASKNLLTGNALANTLDGKGGADTLIGGDGDDTYLVDDALDVVSESNALAAGGVDTVESSSANYTLSANVENLKLTGTLGTENLNGTGNTSANTITGNNGNNILNGGAGNDFLFGGDGDDRLDGGTGNDEMTGGQGNDTYVIDSITDKVLNEDGTSGDSDTVVVSIAAGATYTIDSGSFIENVTLAGATASNAAGNAQNNIITGNSAANTLIGGGGNDTLDGGAGADILTGGSGNDIYVVDNVGDQTVGDSGGTDLVKSSVTWQLAALLENLELTGTAVINGTGNTADNSLKGNAAANILDGRSGKDKMEGGDGNDTYVVDNAFDEVIESTLKTAAAGGIDTVQSSINFDLSVSGINVENLTLTGVATDATGNELANVITGNSMANLIDGKAGADTMSGGLGSDTYIVDNVGDVVVETTAAGGGTDLVKSSVTFTLGANLEDLELTGSGNINGTGNTLNNTITGNNGNNIINGGAGSDKMSGGDGDDTYFVDSIGDRVTETKADSLVGGVDTVNSSVTFSLGANVENLTLSGTAAINGLGNALDNDIIGNTGANFLIGGDGSDLLDGGAGLDHLVGGNGADYFRFSTALSAANLDVIMDFVSGEDQFALDDAIFAASGLAAGLTSGVAFALGTAAQDSDDRIIYDADAGALYYDSDGVGAAAKMQIATVLNGVMLTAGDFVVV